MISTPKKTNKHIFFVRAPKKGSWDPNTSKAKHITEVWRPLVSVYFGDSVSVTSHYWSHSSTEIISHDYESWQIYIWNTEFDVLSASLIYYIDQKKKTKTEKEPPTAGFRPEESNVEARHSK